MWKSCFCRTQEARLPADCSWSAVKLVHFHFSKLGHFFLIFLKYHQNNVFERFNKFTFTCLRHQKASCASLHLSSLTDPDGLKNMSHWKPCTGNLIIAITFITVLERKITHYHIEFCILKEGLVTTSLKSFEFELLGH